MGDENNYAGLVGSRREDGLEDPTMDEEMMDIAVIFKGQSGEPLLAARRRGERQVVADVTQHVAWLVDDGLSTSGSEKCWESTRKRHILHCLALH